MPKPKNKYIIFNTITADVLQKRLTKTILVSKFRKISIRSNAKNIPAMQFNYYMVIKNA